VNLLLEATHSNDAAVKSDHGKYSFYNRIAGVTPAYGIAYLRNVVVTAPSLNIS